jgi:hypothetical protein
VPAICPHEKISCRLSRKLLNVAWCVTLSPYTDLCLIDVRGDKVIVNVTQCQKGRVSDLYETGRQLREVGVIPGHDMTTEVSGVLVLPSERHWLISRISALSRSSATSFPNQILRPNRSAPSSHVHYAVNCPSPSPNPNTRTLPSKLSRDACDSSHSSFRSRHHLKTWAPPSYHQS